MMFRLYHLYTLSFLYCSSNAFVPISRITKDHHRTKLYSKSPQDPTQASVFRLSDFLEGIFKNEEEISTELLQQQSQSSTSLFRNFLPTENETIMAENKIAAEERVDKSLVFPLIASAVGLSAIIASNTGMIPDISSIVASIQNFFQNPTSSLEAVVATVESMGPTGALYFGAVYTIAEVLALPALPLTMSAGYLFGTVQGTAVVLLSASIAAAVAFVIGRTILRSYVEELLKDYPRFAKIDRAIGKEGFKIMLLLRLSPIFPFALSNYLYGATSVGFWQYFFGTMLGFTPGTIAYVYSGEVGKALTLGGGDAQPWYIYLGGFAILGAFLKVVADLATQIIEEAESQESS